MLSRLHSKLGTAGLIISVVALVAALSGAAIAATEAFSPKQKHEIRKIAKKFAKRGKKGAQGPQGVQGEPGPVGPIGPIGQTGPAGETGPEGPEGPEGKEGKAGADGKVGPEGPEGPVGPEGPAGEPGETGPEGPEGPEGPAGPTKTIIPAGQTISGTWSYGQTHEEPVTTESISYGLRYPGNNPPAFHFIDQPGEEAASCPGSASVPQAAPGHICVYQGEAAENPGKFIPFFTEFTNSTSGVTLFFSTQKEGSSEFLVSFASGGWAVTAPTS